MGVHIAETQRLFHQDGLFKLMLRDFFKHQCQRQVARGNLFQFIADHGHFVYGDAAKQT